MSSIHLRRSHGRRRAIATLVALAAAWALAVGSGSVTPAAAEPYRAARDHGASGADSAAAGRDRMSPFLEFGITAPLAPPRLREFYQAGFSVGAGFSYPLSPWLDGRLRLSYDNLPFDTGSPIPDAYSQSLSASGAFSSLAATAGLVLLLPWHVHLSASAGGNMAWAQQVEKYRSDPTSPLGYATDIYDFSGSGYVVGAGAGVHFDTVGRRWFVEVRWMSLGTGEGRAQVLPIRAGFLF